MGKINLAFLCLFLCLFPQIIFAKDYLVDPDNLVFEDFKVTKEFKEKTSFWFDVYTRYSSDHFILHDRESPLLIYKVVSKDDHASMTPSLIQKAILNDYKNAFDQLISGKKDCNLCPQILSILKDKIPKNKAVHSSFYKNLKNNLRFQTGQKNFIEKGLFYYSSYEVKIQEMLKLFNLPRELISIAFLESSFNTEARSRVNATGIWQFMKATGQDYLIIDSKQDQRLNPLISTLGAFHFLKKLHKSLGRWDLAIWSYNSGAQHVRNALKTFERPTMSLSDFFKFYKHPNIGFASQSFYPSFLALTHAIAYKDEIFKDYSKNKYLNLDTLNLHFYLTLCPMTPEWFFAQLSKSPDTRKLNRHLLTRYKNTKYPKGTFIISDRDLTERRYFKVPPEVYTSRYPKNWRHLARKFSCKI